MNSGDVPPLFEVPDWMGRPVRCQRETWDLVVEKHPDRRPRLREVIRAVRAPFLVAQDRDIAVHVSFYGMSDRSDLWQKGAVRYMNTPGGASGEVVTAFRTRRVRHGDAVLYRRGT